MCRVGGEHGWNTSWLWRLRGWLDQRGGWAWAARGRRHPDLLRYGDALDFWRVVGIEPGPLAVLARRDEIAGPGAPGPPCGSRWGFEVHALPDCPLRASGPGRIALLGTPWCRARRRRLSDDARRIQRDAIEIAADQDLDRTSTWSMGGTAHARVTVLPPQVEVTASDASRSKFHDGARHHARLARSIIEQLKLIEPLANPTAHGWGRSFTSACASMLDATARAPDHHQSP